MNDYDFLEQQLCKDCRYNVLTNPCKFNIKECCTQYNITDEFLEYLKDKSR